MPRKRKTPLPPLKLSKETVGERLARLRKEVGLSQLQLAKRIGINQTNVSDYETGRLMMNADMIARFAIALKTTSDTVLGLGGSARRERVPSVRILRRLNKIAVLPPDQKRTLLKSLDMMLKASESSG